MLHDYLDVVFETPFPTYRSVVIFHQNKFKVDHTCFPQGFLNCSSSLPIYTVLSVLDFLM